MHLLAFIYMIFLWKGTEETVTLPGSRKVTGGLEDWGSTGDRTLLNCEQCE